MIRFRPKSQVEINIIDDVLDYLDKDHQMYKVIKSNDAEKIAGLNTKQMVLMYAKETTRGTFQIAIMDKNSVVAGKVYPYTQKLLTSILGLKVVENNELPNILVAESDYKGKLLDAIDILARRYQLSIIKESK